MPKYLFIIAYYNKKLTLHEVKTCLSLKEFLRGVHKHKQLFKVTIFYSNHRIGQPLHFIQSLLSIRKFIILQLFFFNF